MFSPNPHPMKTAEGRTGLGSTAAIVEGSVVEQLEGMSRKKLSLPLTCLTVESTWENWPQLALLPKALRTANPSSHLYVTVKLTLVAQGQVNRPKGI